MKPLKTLIATTVAIGASSLWAANSATQTKEFHIFLPNNTTWQSSTPLINEDGKDHALEVDQDHCGWYIRRYINEPIPQNVLIHRDDDAEMAEAIGINGAWENDASAPESILLNDLFQLADASNAIYLVADEDKAAELPAQNKGLFFERPQIEGTCEFVLATLIYDTDASLHGAFSCEPNWIQGQTLEEAQANACYSPNAKFPVVSSSTEAVPCLGITTGMVESTLSTNENGTKKPKLTAKGKTCFGAQADKAFAAMFEATPGVNEAYCVDVPYTKTADGMFEFNSDTYQSPGTNVPGGFYPAEIEPPTINMLSERLPAAESKRKAEGPTYFCAGDVNSATPLGLRTIHPTEGVPVSDLICNGPGWNGGIDCEGLFAAGGEFGNGSELTDVGNMISKKLGVNWIGDGWAWSCPNASAAPEGWQFYQENSETPATTSNASYYNWKSTDGTAQDDSKILTTSGRNQHYCMESHATFRYKKGLKFSFSSEGDLWVYLDNKLAVDLGGSHLPAPAYVDLDKFMPNAEVGRFYDIDIYSCDRRTTTSTLRIKTNMFVEKASGISYVGKQDKVAYTKQNNNQFKLCYTEGTKGSCASALGQGDVTTCETNIKQPIKFTLTTDPTATDPSKTIISQAEFTQNPVQANGGIDVTVPGKPIVNTDKLQGYVPAGTYYLVVQIGSDKKAIKLQVQSKISVANREAIVVNDKTNNDVTYSFKSMALASTPSIDGSISESQLVPLYIATIVDPCNSGSICGDPLLMQSAAGATYSLQSSSNQVIFFAKKNGKLMVIDPSASRTIGASGIDTVYATIPADELSAEAEKVSINVKGSSRIAEITFFAPKLVFVKSEASLEVVSSDPDSKIRLQGASYEIYLIALRPDNTICTECNFNVSKGIQTSVGINLIAGGQIINGRGIISILASKTYEKGTASGTATLHIVGPQSALTSIKYTNMQFVEGTLAAPETKVPAKADFSITTVNPLEFVISTSNLQQGAAKKFAVMDMKGQIITTGRLASNTHVKVPTSGSYVVKVGQGYKRVNLK